MRSNLPHNIRQKLVLDVLKFAPGKGARQITELIFDKHGYPLKRTDVSSTLQDLKKKGLARKEGKKRGATWFSTEETKPTPKRSRSRIYLDIANLFLELAELE